MSLKIVDPQKKILLMMVVILLWNWIYRNEVLLWRSTIKKSSLMATLVILITHQLLYHGVESKLAFYNIYNV